MLRKWLTVFLYASLVLQPLNPLLAATASAPQAEHAAVSLEVGSIECEQMDPAQYAHQGGCPHVAGMGCDSNSPTVLLSPSQVHSVLTETYAASLAYRFASFPEETPRRPPRSC